MVSFQPYRRYVAPCPGASTLSIRGTRQGADNARTTTHSKFPIIRDVATTAEEPTPLKSCRLRTRRIEFRMPYVLSEGGMLVYVH